METIEMFTIIDLIEGTTTNSTLVFDASQNNRHGITSFLVTYGSAVSGILQNKKNRKLKVK